MKKNKIEMPEIKFRSQFKIEPNIHIPLWPDRCADLKYDKHYKNKFDEYFWIDFEDESNDINLYLNKWIQPQIYELFCLKRTDAITSHKLYNSRYNPITIRFTYWQDDEDKKMKLGISACLISRDDHYYGMHKYKTTRMEGIEIIQKLVNWIDKQIILSGDEWWELGKSLEFDYFFDN